MSNGPLLACFPPSLLGIEGLWAVGGAVRDALLDTPPAEVDLIGDGPAWEAAKAVLEGEYGQGHEVQDRFQTLRFAAGGRIQVDLSRQEGDLDADLSRRDFTANAIAWSPDKGLYDPLGGEADIAARRLSPATPGAHADDPLRILRGLRLEATRGLLPDSACLAGMTAAAPGLAKVAGERVREEFSQGFPAAPAAYAARLDEVRALDALFPFWPATRTTPAGTPDDLSVSAHSLAAVANFAEVLANPAQACPDLATDLRAWGEELGTPPWWWWLGCLLHDVGKPPTLTTEEGRRRYRRHPQVGAGLAAPCLEALRLSNQEAAEVLAIIGGHLRVSQVAGEDGIPGRRARYRFFRDYGDLAIPLVLHDLADAMAYPAPVRDDILDPRHRRIHKELLAGWFLERDSVAPPRLVTGHDLIALGYEPGPALGDTLEAISLAQVDGTVADREGALALARDLLAEGPA